jgi:hypothetical protein
VKVAPHLDEPSGQGSKLTRMSDGPLAVSLVILIYPLWYLFCSAKYSGHFSHFKYILVLDVLKIKVLDHENAVQNNLKFLRNLLII